MQKQRNTGINRNIPIQRYIFFTMLVFSVFLVSGCAQKLLDKQNDQNFVLQSTGKYEISKVDVFSEKNWKGTDVAVLGVVLGDSKEAVIEKLGLPDKEIQYLGGNATNLEYSKQLTIAQVGLLIHLDNNKVTRMTFKKPFNRFLVGDTQITNQTKQWLFNQFGKPSRLKLLTFFTQYEYHERGLEVFLDGQEMNGFSIVYPKREESHIVVNTVPQIPSS